jgi:hypothetical protein
LRAWKKERELWEHRGWQGAERVAKSTAQIAQRRKGEQKIPPLPGLAGLVQQQLDLDGSSLTGRQGIRPVRPTAKA